MRIDTKYSGSQVREVQVSGFLFISDLALGGCRRIRGASPKTSGFPQGNRSATAITQTKSAYRAMLLRTMVQDMS